MSFRRRLLLLILSVSLLQVLAAFATFHGTESTPQRLRYEAQLNESVNKVLFVAARDALAARAPMLSAAAADQQLSMAVAAGDKTSTERQLASIAAAGDHGPLFVTDTSGRLVAGVRPGGPLVEGGTVRLDGPAGQARLLHAPVVLDSAFLARANSVTSSTLVAITGSHLVSAAGTAVAPRDISAGFGTVRVNGRDYHMLLRPTDAAHTAWIGAAVPESTISASSRTARTQLWLFFAALAVLAVIIAWIVTSAVGSALSVFAERAERVADGHLDDRIPVVGEDEMAGASSAFNTMAAALKDRIHGLEAAEARLQRQVRLFGDVLTSEDSVDRKLEAVCEVATQTTAAEQARFWSSGDAGFELVASVGVTAEHAALSGHEAQALREQRIITAHEDGISVIVAPAVRDDECLGLLTICSAEQELGQRDGELAGRLAAQAAVAIDNARLHDAMRDEHHLLARSFSQYVPASVVEQLLERGETVELGGTQKDVSVLFCDIRGFTSWSEKLPPTTVVAELNALLAVLCDCVFETDGTLDKFTGDGLMALWGAPLDQPDHADRACRAALMMEDRLSAFNAEHGMDFRIGVGIHSGAAVVGNIGHDRRHDYTAIGDTVNLSARIEAATKELGATVLVSKETIARAGLPVVRRFEQVGDISVKGRSQQVTVFRRSADALVDAKVADDEPGAAAA
jgi:class 3 adenylate cyclase/HAMP domain-containing protein